MGTSIVSLTFGALAILVVERSASASPACQKPNSPGVVVEPASSGMRFIATGEATIMSDTAEGLLLAEDAARLDAKALMHADLRILKTTDNQLRGVRDLQACQDHGKFFVTVFWDEAAAKQAMEASDAMSSNSSGASGPHLMPSRGIDRSKFDRLIAEP